MGQTRAEPHTTAAAAAVVEEEHQGPTEHQPPQGCQELLHLQTGLPQGNCTELISELPPVLSGDKTHATDWICLPAVYVNEHCYHTYRSMCIHDNIWPVGK